jgi:hypothetical protein
LDNTTNEATYADLYFTSTLCVGVMGLLSNSLLLWLLTCAHIKNIFTANNIRTNLAVFHIFFDILYITKSVLVLRRELRCLDRTCRVYIALGALFGIGTVLNYLFLAINHYCLHKSCRKKIFGVLNSRRNTFIAITATWLLVALGAAAFQQHSRRIDRSRYLQFRCRDALPKKFETSIMASLYIAVVATVIINYRVYKSVASWLREHTEAVYRKKSVITKLRSVRSSLIITVWFAINLGIVLLVKVLALYYKWKMLYRLKTISSMLLIITVQLNALIAQVVTDRRSRKKLWSLFPWPRGCCKGRRRRRVRPTTERFEIDGTEQHRIQ